MKTTAPVIGNKGAVGESGGTKGIGFLLQRAHNSIRTALTARLNGTGLHLGHVAILGTLLARPGINQRELSVQTGIEKSSIVIFLDALESDGWVRRDRDPQDRRAHALSLTEAGKARLETLGPGLVEAEEAFLSALSSNERLALASALTKLIAHAESL